VRTQSAGPNLVAAELDGCVRILRSATAV
jgi:hypothetical protein